MLPYTATTQHSARCTDAPALCLIRTVAFSTNSRRAAVSIARGRQQAGAQGSLRRSPGNRRQQQQQQRLHQLRWPAAAANGVAAAAATDGAEGSSPLVAVEGDVVTVEYVCKDVQGNVLASSAEDGEPATFEIGAGDVVGNKLFKAFDEAVRGLPIGSDSVLRANGGEWNRDLMFDVPANHDEITRLEQRYKNVGGLAEGLVVELSNGQPAVVLKRTPEVVRLDANNMLAGKELVFELKLTGIERSAA